MKNTFALRPILLLVAILTLSGCLMVPVDDGFHHGNSRGGHHRDHHDGPGDHR